MNLSEERHNKLLNKIEEIKEIEEDIKNITFPKEKCNLSEYLKRPEVKIIDYVDKLNKKYSKEALEQVEINHKYEGYIIKAKKEADKLKRETLFETKEEVNKLRKRNAWSQEELAEKLDVTRQTVSKWELGTINPKMDKIQEMSKIFNVTLEELTNEEEIIKEKGWIQISDEGAIKEVVLKILGANPQSIADYKAG